MIYALNVFDLVDEDLYAEYVSKLAPLMEGIDMEPYAVAFNQIRDINGGGRDRFMLAKFGSIEEFDRLMARLEEADLHKLREKATANYIWTLYDPIV